MNVEYPHTKFFPDCPRAKSAAYQNSSWYPHEPESWRTSPSEQQPKADRTKIKIYANITFAISKKERALSFLFYTLTYLVYLFLLPHTTVERKSLKLGIHLNLKAASLRLSRYHLISATVTHRTLLYTIKDIHTWRQLCIEVSNEMSQGKLSSQSQYHSRKISLGFFQKFTTQKWFTSLSSPVSFQSLHRTNPQISITPSRPLFHYFCHQK